MQQPLKNFLQKKIEATIGGALCQLTGANYTVDIKSIESPELTLDERNRQAIYRKSEPVLMQKDKIVLVVNRHVSSADDEEETAEIALKRQ
jgi:hypothetical protein